MTGKGKKVEKWVRSEVNELRAPFLFESAYSENLIFIYFEVSTCEMKNEETKRWKFHFSRPKKVVDSFLVSVYLLLAGGKFAIWLSKMKIFNSKYVNGLQKSSIFSYFLGWISKVFR